MFGCKVGGCHILEILKEVAHEALLNYGSKTGFKFNHREEFVEERIFGLDIWDNHGRRVSCESM